MSADLRASPVAVEAEEHETEEEDGEEDGEGDGVMEGSARAPSVRNYRTYDNASSPVFT